MSYEPLHHKYRPQTFAELVGQEAIATTLSNALRQQRIAPAYLFTGARGTGKTSSARILAKSLNCLASDTPTAQPCGKCEACRMIAKGAALDVIEIDAASNTGVDNIRELIERSQFAPVQCRYKVYVVDECHMLSTAAFNALLKTLEEPPDRVVFVLATTDPQRVLPTIISRCQRFDFRRIPLEAMVTHLGQIAEKEAIDVTPEAIQLVAQISQGGLRDAEALLDQLSLLEGSITVERVWDLVGAVPERDLFELVQAIAQDDATTVLDQARHLMDRGREPLIVLQNLASFYRDLLIAKASPDRQDLVAITPMTWEALCEFVQGLEIGTILRGQQHLREAEIQVRNTAQPRLWLEVTLMGLLPSAIGSRESGVGSWKSGVGSRVAGGQGRSAPAKQGASSSSSQPQKTERRLEEAASPEKRPSEREWVEKRPVEKVETPIADVEPQVEEPIEEIAAVAIDPALSATSSAVPSQDLEQIWQEAIDQIRFRGTQVLLQQQGHLLFFDGFEARVGIKSQPLFKMAKEKLSVIEAAFEAVYQHKVRVSLEVTTASEVQTTLLEQSLQPQPAQPAQPSVKPSPPQSRSVKESASSSSGKFSGEPPSSSPPSVQTSTPSQLPSPLADPPDMDLAAATPIPWQEDDEVSGAAKSLAQFFNGQIVSLENDLPVGKIEDSTLELSETEADEEDSDDDVPF
ncbi:DNA polymerase III subunit gamma/tau [filamentous cyanobacterium CCP2]|nr:DNA polymerase III subunit gamma/tau [filamentous cyanobacterium CCP2]PSB15503.1 DNA polymerase III subunit gamma/tau [filamentous cyanobacterium CCP2]